MSMVGGDPWVMLLGPDACEAALRNADKAFANGPAWTFLVGPFFGRGLMFLDFEEHHLHRRIMQQAFTRDRLEGYVAPMHSAIAAGLSTWQPTATGSRPTGRSRSSPSASRPRPSWAAPSTPRPRRWTRVNKAFIACVQAAASIVRHDVPFTRWHRGHEGPAAARGVRARLPAVAAGDRLRRPALGALPHRVRQRRAVQRRRRRQPHDLPDDGGARHLDVHALGDAREARPAPGVAGALPGRGDRAARPRRRHPVAGRPRQPGGDRPGDEGEPAAARAGPGRAAQDRQGDRRARHPHPRGHLLHRRPPVQPPDAGAVDLAGDASTRSGSTPSAARTARTATPGSPSAAACTSASACSSPAPR